MSTPRRRTLALAGGWLVLLASLSVHAEPDRPTENPERVLQTLRSGPSAALVKQATDQAARALERVRDARAASDGEMALALTALANDWLQIAKDVLRAVALERELFSAQQDVARIRKEKQHTETLLEETVAQRERSAEQLRRDRTSGPPAPAPESAPKQSQPAGTP